MEIRVQSIKFNADVKLLDFVEKKFSRLEKFYDAVTAVDVALSLLPEHDNKNVKVQVSIPGNTIVVEKNAKTFEDAVVDCADILKEKDRILYTRLPSPPMHCIPSPRAKVTAIPDGMNEEEFLDNLWNSLVESDVEMYPDKASDPAPVDNENIGMCLPYEE